MAFSVQLFSFSKRENSTARPTGTAREFSCIVRTGTGILRPSIVLDIGLSESPAQYNYAYIPAFKRYYFIEEWVFEERLWQAQLSVDVLATYKAEIGAANLYVLRAAADYDGRIIDNLYPTKTECDYATSRTENPWGLLGDGCFILGIVSKSPRVGSVNYYALTSAGLQSLIKNLVDNTVTSSNGFDFNDASQALQLSLIDPLQYIKSAVFVPVPFSSIAGVVMPAITVFNWTINAGGSNVKLIGQYNTITNLSFDTIKHPQTQSRGSYVNVSPYTKATISIPPFGVIELDTTVICDVDAVTAQVKLDLFTGLGILKIYANDILLHRLETQVGVPIQLSQITRNYLGAMNNIMGAAGSVAGAITSGLAGNVAGAISGGIGAISGIGNAAAQLVPRSQSIGQGGAFSPLTDPARLDFQFFECVDDDITQNGRPLMQKRTPASLGGYMLIQDGDVSTTGTADENRTIRSYLEGGFYYE